MSEDSYSLSEYVGDLRAITAECTDDKEIIKKVRPLAQRLALAKSWLKDDHYQCNEEQGFGVHPLHEEPDHTLAVFAASWLPGRGVPPHNHGTWAVVAGVDGPERNGFWNRLDDGSRPGHAEIELRAEKTFDAGEVIALLPDHIHSVVNDTDRVTVSLHTYGMHVNFTQRIQYDTENNLELPFQVIEQ